MKICILNSSDGRYGGFSAVVRLHESLLKQRCDSIMMVAKKQSNDVRIIEVSKLKYNFSRLLTRVSKYFFKIVNKKYNDEYYFDPYGKGFVSAKNILDKMTHKPDVIIANWINGFVSVAQLNELSKMTGAPVIWYLLDMSPFTGGCHFAWSCAGYKKSCGKCPAIESSYGSDASNKHWLYKEKYINALDLTVVSGTQWLHNQSVNSSLFKNKINHKIMLSVNENIFKPIDRNKAKKLIGIKNNIKTIFFGAKSISEKRKGMVYLVESLNYLAPLLKKENIDVLLLIAGDGGGVGHEIDNYYHKCYLGYIHNDEMLAAAYQSANVYLSPSIEDSGPMMINESVMCGTPVVAFDIGVAKELVVNGETGYKVDLYDSINFADGIYKILSFDSDKEKIMSEKCRSLAMRLCSQEVQATEFMNLFKTIIE